ncbi:MAG TPA: Do family serine endopeptidase [Thermoguttaceae bacterium]|nr:Do family serine endopeptidase [Thermoguttaceae bacterium]
MKKGNVRTGRWLLVWTLLAAVGIGGVIWQGAVGQNRAVTDDSQAIAQAKSLSRAFRSAAEKVMPTVVKIKTTTKPRRIDTPGPQGPDGNPFEGTPFEDFFNDRDLPRFNFPHSIPRRQGVGSGVVIDRQGIILTNNHVVEGADEVLVEFSDGRQFKAADIKTDEQTDLAVLRIDAGEPLPAARLGDSDQLEIGDWVIAVGNPFELDGTVSAGIISGKGRALQAGKRTNFLQTDAAINPGNSGGPLVNLDGEVVGINTAIASNSGGYQGVGFAIPSNVAKWVTDQLIQRGSVQRAYLGVGIEQISNEIARKLGVEPNRGVLVSEVFRDTPAAKAGFQAGDVILAFAGRDVNSPRELQEIVERSSAGSKQQADIIRDGKRTTLQVEVKPLPEDFGVAQRESRAPSTYQNPELGLEVGEMTDELAKHLGYEELSGVLVTEVKADGLAAEVGVRAGDLILRVGKTPVKSIAEFEAAVKKESLQEGIMLLIRTQQGNRFVVLKSS